MSSIPAFMHPSNRGPLIVITLGIMLTVVGVIVTALGYASVPDRATLTEVSGVLESATKVSSTRGSSTRVSYKFSIRAAGGGVVELTLPERAISEETVRSLLRRPVVALYSDDYSGEKDLWDLTSGNTKIIDYQVTRQRRVETQEFEAAVGPYVGGGGLLVSLVGVFWLFRRRRVAATA